MSDCLIRREAALRTAAIACLAALAIAQLAAVPYARVQGTQIAVLCVAAMACALRLAVALATAGDARGRSTWRAVAALGAVCAGAWLATRAVAVPGAAEDTGHWVSVPGLPSATLALALIGLAVAAAGVPRGARGLRTLAAVSAICAALAPAAALALVGLGPAPGHHHGSAPASVGGHASHATAAPPATAFRPGFGGHSGHYVYPNAARAHLPPWALALALGAAATLVSLAAGGLRRRVVATQAVRGRAAAARRRALTLVVLCALALAVPAAGASAHATLVRASPAALARIATSPARVALTFSEPVQVVRPGDVALLDHAGRAVPASTRSRRGGGRVVLLALRAALAADSYTVRYRVISADSHELDGALVFAVGRAPLLPPAGHALAGPSETGVWAVDARFAELAALSLVLALVAFRLLVWEPAVAGAALTAEDRTAAARTGRRVFWRGLWCVVALAAVAEAGVLVVKAALVFGSGVWGSLVTPAAAERLLASSRFGDLLGWRAALLCAIAAVALWAWVNDASGERDRRDWSALTLVVLSATALGLVSAQGHASQAPAPAVSIAFDAVHLGAAAVWIGGLACLGFVLRVAPRAMPGGAGVALAAAALRRFSRVALWSVAIIVVTGLVRAAGELGAPAQLWTTPYGRSLALKALLLAAIAVPALRNRRAVSALAAGRRPTAAALRAFWRDVRAELVVGVGIVLVASVLVAQVPGRA